MNFLQLSILLLLLLIFLNLIQNIRNLREEEKVTLKQPLPLISVLIPARNEEKNIKKCVSSLLNSDYPLLEIIVLDDDSSDRTWEIITEMSLKDSRIRAIKGKKLPSGWAGKCWACHQLSLAARGEWLLFTDADTLHKSNSISKALAIAQKRSSNLVTCVPGLITKTWSEKLFLPIIHFAFFALFPYNIINYKENSRFPFGIGPFLFIQKNFYFSLGGHLSIKDSLLDDMELAQRVMKEGGKITVIDGTKIVEVRFATCFQEVWKGFSKNTYEFVGNPLYLLMIYFCFYFVFVYPYLLLFSSIFSKRGFLLPLLQVVTISLTKIILSLRFKTNFIYGQLHPLSVVFAYLILFNSFRLYMLKKKIEWKERYYPVE